MSEIIDLINFDRFTDEIFVAIGNRKTADELIVRLIMSSVVHMDSGAMDKSGGMGVNTLIALFHESNPKVAASIRDFAVMDHLLFDKAGGKGLPFTLAREARTVNVKGKEYKVPKGMAVKWSQQRRDNIAEYSAEALFSLMKNENLIMFKRKKSAESKPAVPAMTEKDLATKEKALQKKFEELDKARKDSCLHWQGNLQFGTPELASVQDILQAIAKLSSRADLPADESAMLRAMLLMFKPTVSGSEDKQAA